jgi:hypothetical protein
MVVARFEWKRPPSVLVKALDVYESRVMQAVASVATYFEPILETHAKKTAPWTDRTGNARQTLFSVSELAEDVVRLYLSHGMEYGVYLELRHAGRYAVILPTLQAHYGQIGSMLQDIFR